ncbi:MAG: outer membrane protein assembly factor BamE [Pseudomonadota bacterium]|nr:outer membrane protein assembly factor BamE [Pseudomonadota bacterium]
MLTSKAIRAKESIWICFFCLITIVSCVYQADISQGNKLEDKNIEAVTIGMTRNQVRFLLGTPITLDPFHSNRWDYIYYFQKGRSANPERRWVIVWFDENKVRKVEKNVPTKPES